MLAGEQHRWGARATLMAFALFHVFEDTGDDIGLGHFANHTKWPAASGTGREVDSQHPVEPGHPTHRRCGRYASVLGSLSAGTGVVPGHDEVTVPGIGRKQTVIARDGPVVESPGRRDER